MISKFMMGAPLLCGDNTSPGLQLPDELKALLPDIYAISDKIGLDCYPTIIQKLTYDQISEVAAYGGFGVRYPHWQWGMEYQSLQHNYEYGLGKIFEMVVNNSPCWIYCLDSNSLTDDIMVIIHALGHNHFFKNNVFFSKTRTNMMDQLADHAAKIREYIARWGKERVTEFIDHILRLTTLVDPAAAWVRREYKDFVYKDVRKHHQLNLIPTREDHEYMDPYLNPEDWVNKQKSEIKNKEIKEYLGLDQESETKDILGFLKNHAPLKTWQHDIVSMLYEEALYFAPQRMTKMLNEGFASYIDHVGMVRHGLCALGQNHPSAGIVSYGKHKAGVLGPKYSMNPYKFGYTLLMDIEERWNKGRYGEEYDNCKDMDKRRNWDTGANKGVEKVFEVAASHCDLTLILEYFTPEFCDKHEFYEYGLDENNNYKILNRDPEKIREKLVQKYTNGGLPDIRKVDSNHKGKGKLLLEHRWQGQTLYEEYLKPVMQSLHTVWQNDIVLTSCDSSGAEIVFLCDGNKDSNFSKMSRKTYEKQG